MSTEWDSEAYAILSQVAELESDEERADFLDEACAGDQELRARVERLLSVYHQAGSFLDSPVVPIAETTGEQDDTICSEIGGYKILQELGEGGFGVVYMAEQQRPVRRKVALKVIKPGMDSREVIARFEAEQQALAMMDHPNIARVLDAGLSVNGRPFFAMELVKGVPITEYCDKNQLPLPERLRLFVTVCRAVQHAHQKGVIHRDIKPSNIMVTLHDGEPVPKVIDFGVAKAIGQQLTEKTLFTHYGQMIGTPQYMSPEQAEMSGLDIDTRSDIYSLGVLLYEILTGTTPVTADQLRATAFAEIQRVICQEEPPTPSTRLSTLGDRLTIIASHRQCDAVKLRQLVHGELDWIVMKSLEKERARRYETANDFATDVEAYLNDQPVHARPPSFGYILGKTFRKHRILVTTSALVVTVLVAATAISIWQAIDKYELSKVADEAREQAVASLNQARTEAERANQARQQALQLKEAVELAKDQARRDAYASDMNDASTAYANGRMELVLQKLDKQPAELRNFDWYHWWLSAHLHKDLEFDLTPKWSMTVSPNRDLVAVGVWPQVMRLYRTTGGTPELVAELPNSQEEAFFSSNGRWLATIDSDRRHIHVWDTSSGDLLESLDGDYVTDFTAVAFSMDRLVAGDKKGKITLWDADTRHFVGRIANASEAAIRHLNFVKNGTAVVASAENGELIAFDVHSLSQIDRTRPAAWINALAIAPTADRIVTAAGGSIQLWDEDLTRIQSISVGEEIACLAFSPDGHRLVAGTSERNRILVWNLNAKSPELLAAIKGHVGRISGVAFLPDSNTVWSTSHDYTIRVWDLDRCEPSYVLNDPKSASDSRLAYSADGQFLMIVRDGGKVRRWDLNERRWRPDGPNADRIYSSVAISSDGAALAGVPTNRPNELCYWTADNPGVVITSELPQRTLPSNWSFSPPLAVTGFGEKVALPFEGASTTNTGIIVFNVRAGDESCRIPPATDTLSNPAIRARSTKVWPVFSPDGRRLAVQRFDRTELWDITRNPAGLGAIVSGFWPTRLRSVCP